MKDKLYISILALLSISSCGGSGSSSVQEQKQAVADITKTKKENPLDSPLNQKDEQGRKQGLWIEDNGLTEVYYLNGKKHGIYKAYFEKTGKLGGLGEYENSKPKGTWYYFDETSRLVMIENKLAENKDIKVKNGVGAYVLLPYRSIIKIYNKNGILIKEGMGLYDEDVQLDFYMFGTWKYYNETGKLIREENYKEGKIAD